MCWRPRRESNPPPPVRQTGARTSGRRGRDERAWWWCAGEDSHLHKRGPHAQRGAARGLHAAGFTDRPSRRAFRHACLACHAYSVFKVRVPDLRVKKKGAWRRQAPCQLLMLSESSSRSRKGSLRPGDARFDSHRMRACALAGRLARGRARAGPASRLRLPTSSSSCSCSSWQRQHMRSRDALSSSQFDQWSY